MNDDTEAAPPENIWQKIVHSALGRIVVLLMAILAGTMAAYMLVLVVGGLLPPHSPVSSLLEILILTVVVTGAYLGAMRLFEQRSPLALEELSLSGAGRELGGGILLGAGLLTLTIAVLWLLGVYRPSGWNGLGWMIPALAANLPPGVIQELAFRGVIFRLSEEKMGAYSALLISAVVFGLIHAAGDQATPLGILSAALIPGVLLSTAYLLTRRLWLPIGITVAWGFARDGIFGAATGAATSAGTGTAGTGIEPIRGLIQAALSGPALLTGGAAGVEASIVTLLVVGIAAALLARQAWKTWGYE